MVIADGLERRVAVVVTTGKTLVRFSGRRVAILPDAFLTEVSGSRGDEYEGCPLGCWAVSPRRKVTHVSEIITAFMIRKAAYLLKKNLETSVSFNETTARSIPEYSHYGDLLVFVNLFSKIPV
jgi:hypothetical protein